MDKLFHTKGLSILSFHKDYKNILSKVRIFTADEHLIFEDFLHSLLFLFCTPKPYIYTKGVAKNETENHNEHR